MLQAMRQNSLTVPTIVTVPLKVVAAISSTLILLSLPIPLQTTEVDKLITSTETVIGCSASLPATSVATMVTASLSCAVACIVL
jgi:hypothetical protein